MLNEIDLSRADLNLLVLFEVVFRERHVRRAAQRLRLSSSAVSHGLRRLRGMLDDPLFLKTPTGVVPTSRATELAEPISEVLARVRHVLACVEPFDPATTARRFRIGAPDSAVVLFRVLADLRRCAPGIDLSLHEVHPQTALAALEARSIDIALAPLADLPARFSARPVCEERFVIAARAGHPFFAAPTLEHYCTLRHIVVSLHGDERGFIDEILEQRGLCRRVAVTVPHSMLALALLAESDLVGAFPRAFVAMHAARYGLANVATPFPLPRFELRAITQTAALADAGTAWLFDQLSAARG